MRRNTRRSKRMSVVAKGVLHLGSVLVTLFVVVMFNLLANSRNAQIIKSIGEKERLGRSLDNEIRRQGGRWDELRSAENLDRTLLRFGMAMSYPRPDQVVRMTDRGTVRPGQYSVAKIMARKGTAETARVAPAPAAPQRKARVRR